jgi:hypothetical protein
VNRAYDGRLSPDPADEDNEPSLETLRASWGASYAVCFDDAIGPGGARWRAWRLGDSGDHGHGHYAGRAERCHPGRLHARERDVSGLPLPGLGLVPDEPDQVLRLARFRAEHTAAVIGEADFGTWQARIPEPSGETVVVRHRLVELLDRLGELFGEPPV